MFFSITPFVLLLISLFVIIIIIVRKFPQLTLLDVENIPEVRQCRQKDDLLRKRVDKNFAVSQKSWSERIKPIIKKLKEIQLSFRKYVGKVEKEAVSRVKRKDKPIKPVGAEETHTLEILTQEAVHAFEEGKYDLAEEKYISAIRLDPRNKKAYSGLGDVYINQDQIEEAEETLEFLLTLDKNNDAVYVKLGNLAEEKGDITRAVEFYQQAILINDQISTRFIKLSELLRSLEEYDTALEAVSQALELEPNNPKYLDKMVEIAIMVGDSGLAEEAYNQLRMVNPENQKLEALRSKIDKM
ncbi:tetratricopeptide repeat protein, partial [Patescibacteria group bacterium]|nr:tetratricopeptide repeat protein [Patescibacteria group bacterium]